MDLPDTIGINFLNRDTVQLLGSIHRLSLFGFMVGGYEKTKPANLFSLFFGPNSSGPEIK